MENIDINATKRPGFFERMAAAAVSVTGSPGAFVAAVLIIVIWAVTGPVFKFSDTWQLVVNTGTTIVTFLMVFLIQKAQNKDSKSIQLKLNELIAANRSASNRLIDVESLTEEELDVLHKYYCKMVEITSSKMDVKESHSVEEAISEALEKHEETLIRRKKKQ
ncbi:low affinity iron permease family protein [Chitinophaga polysaccharea]|uniref:low affinity iron permease family protein n=1 Tax=Chitinophaga TaxID=79328 RepID=UPI0014557E67|nr:MULTISPECIES: low affinity iron permease family protein [Chitinophaga]NLR58204.1 low affinity iron permease family protein [Chitinophaga polysaccharea]NLU90728.1 low affinity iron permease family protein [Chitinophaga sp. Ak27]